MLNAIVFGLYILGCVNAGILFRGITPNNGTETTDTYLQGDSLYISLMYEQTSEPSQGQASGGRPGSATSTHSCNNIRAVPSTLRSAHQMAPNGLGHFYQKYTEAYGIPVLGSSYLSDSALQRACYVVRFVFADRYEARNSYYKMYGRFALMGVNEVTTSIPEHRDLGSWWDTRARGLGATRQRPVSTGGEENALCLSNDRYSNEDILLHEFVHGVHLLGTRYSIPNFDTRLRTLYDRAKASGKWYNTYAMSTDHEYFAEGVQSYFNVNAYANPPNGIHNHVNTREKLQDYDRGLYDLVQEVFPCGNNYIDRCNKDRASELSQVLSMNCAGGNGGEDCEDSDSRCSSWASDGWCDRCSDYMHEHCKLSCQVCEDGGGTDCEDTSSHCSYWAGIGECQKNPDYMLGNCKKSCQVC